MSPLEGLWLGLGLVLQPSTAVLCFAGVALGTLVGVLPGIGPVATVALLLPATFQLEPAGALVMLAGIYYGAQYGSSTAAILVNLPGEASGVVTALDGHAIAKRGRAGPAIAIAALSSFVGGVAATFAIAWLAPIFVRIGLAFGPEHFALLLFLGIAASVALSPAAGGKAAGGAAIGVFLGLIGTDSGGGMPRFAFGVWELADGIGFAIVAMGVYGLGEIADTLSRQGGAAWRAPLGRVRHHCKELIACAPPTFRATIIGSLIGLLPGGSTVLASFAAFAIEKRFGRRRRRIGKGAMEGVAASEAANNAAAQTSFVPLLSLGLPGNAVMAVMIGAMMLQGVLPGPLLAQDRPDLFWTIIASMLLGNVMLLALNLPLAGLWARILTIPDAWLFSAIVTICAAGAYSLQRSIVDVFLLFAFGVLGFAMRRLACDPTPFFVGFVMAPMLDDNLRRALVLARGDVGQIFADPGAALLLACIVAFVIHAARKNQDLRH